MKLNISDFVGKYPLLYHMAEDGSWASIEKNGLLSTTALLDNLGVDKKERVDIEEKIRSDTITLSRNSFGDVKIRDQKAMREGALSQSLGPGISIADWCKYINAKVFFWSNWVGLKILISANAYAGKPHIVLTVDTERLIRVYKDKIYLSSINSGSTYFRKGKNSPEKRDYGTFKRIEEFNNFQWVREVCIDYSIPDISDYLVKVERYLHSGNGYQEEPKLIETLWHQ